MGSIFDHLEPQELIRVWTPQARQLAEKSRTPDPVARFLHGKGIPLAEASETAIALWNEARRSGIRRNTARLIVGWGLIVIAALAAAYILFAGSSVLMLAGVIGPLALGITILGGDLLR